MLQNLLSEVALVDVHIDFGCADIFVSEHGLDGSQVGPSLQELRGKTVAEGVWADVLLDSRLLGILFNIYEERYPAEVFASPKRDEDVVVLARLYCDALSDDEPLPQLLDGVLADGNQPFLPSLAMNSDVSLFEIEFAQLQIHQLADSEATTEQDFYDGEVADAFRFAQVYRGFYRVDFRQTQHFRQVFAYFRTLEQLCGVGLDLFLDSQETVERTDSAQDSSYGTRSHAKLLQRLRELVQLLKRDLAEVDALVRIVVEELLEVLEIGVEGVRSVRTLEPQILEVTANNGVANRASIC